MIDFIKNFHTDEDGAVTVDWVVLTAAVVGLGVAAVGAVKGSIGTLSSAIATEVGKVKADGSDVDTTTP